MTSANATHEKSRLAVIVLNWNGWKDTLECLASLLDSGYQDFRIIVVDNGSTDDSLEMMGQWAGGEISTSVGPHRGESRTYHAAVVEHEGRTLEGTAAPLDNRLNERRRVIDLIKNKTNLGFAGGNNVGIRFALARGFDRILLLNNDTTVDPECLEILSDFMDQNEQYKVTTPRLNYYHPPDLIRNCGGKLTLLGTRKYYCRNKQEDQTAEGVRDITFVTGCALMARAEVFRKHGLLSERFFFGEEDFEFSLRMKLKKIRMASVSNAVVYHKVGASKRKVFEEDPLPRAFIHHLNRFVNLKAYYSAVYWKLWRSISLVYLLPMLKAKYRLPVTRLFKFVSLLRELSDKNDSVTKEDFFRAKDII